MRSFPQFVLSATVLIACARCAADDSQVAAAPPAEASRVVDQRGRESEPTTWRRTVHGWERRDRWQLHMSRSDSTEPTRTVHPLVVALLELLISVGALIAFPIGQRSRRENATRRKRRRPVTRSGLWCITR